MKRTSCPFLVLRVSLRCLIYKVHTANSRREFHSTTFSSPCQHLFSNFFEIFCRPTVAVFSLSLEPQCFAAVFLPVRFARPFGLSLKRLAILPPPPRFVNTFFHLFLSFFCFFSQCPCDKNKRPQKYRLHRAKNYGTLNRTMYI